VRKVTELCRIERGKIIFHSLTVELKLDASGMCAVKLAVAASEVSTKYAGRGSMML